MASPSRDRVTIDLCGIGGAARAAARERGVTLSVLARQSLIAALPSDATALTPTTAPRADVHTVKLSVRLTDSDSEALAMQAKVLGISQARMVALMIRGAELPMPRAIRSAERAALRASTDELAALSADLRECMRLMREGRSDAAERYRQRIQTVDADIRRHLDRAGDFLAGSSEPITRRSAR